MQAAMLLKEIPCYGHLLLHNVFLNFQNEYRSLLLVTLIVLSNVIQ